METTDSAGAQSSEEGLAELVAQFDTLIEGAPLGIGIFDLDVRHVRVNPALEQMNGQPAAQLLGRTPEEVNGEVGRQAEKLYRQVMDSGEAMLDVHLTGEVTARPGHLRHWSTSFHPIRERGGEVLGLCVIVDDITAEHELIEELASSERRYRILAEDLQRSLLPPDRPVLPGLDVAAVYRPAASMSAVGGDFYDVIGVGEGRWMLVIGDVQGKGPLAASLGAAVRYAIRAAVVVDPDPARVLSTVNEVLLHLPGEDRLCTAVCLLLEQHGTDFSARSVAAGHPLPLVLRAGDGSVQPLAGSGTLLGAVPDLHLGEASTTLTPGDSVLLYTDGATEARAPRHDAVELFGESALRATLASARGHDATAIAATITKAVQTFSGGALTDDLALLVLRVDGA